MPHVNVKHFPVPLAPGEESALVAAITDAVTTALRCDAGVVSVALEPVDEDAWNERVYAPEIVERAHLLRKRPDY